MHDTANDNSTIEGEINYMRIIIQMRLYHVDGNRIIETALLIIYLGELDHGNNRFINVEIHTLIMLHLHVQ